MRSRKRWGELAGILIALLACGETWAQVGGSPPGVGQPPPSLPDVSPGAVPGNVPPPPLFGAGHAGDAHAPAIPAEESSDGWLSGLAIDGEYLFLKPHRQAMDYAITNPTGGNVPNGSIVYQNWDWSSAFRAGLAYRLPGQQWSVGFFYTYLHNDTSGSTDAPDGGTLFATQTHPGTVSQVQTAAALTSLNYNVFDLELGRWWHPCASLGIRPFAGGRFARIDQNFTALYNGGDATRDQVAQRLHFNGGGFRVGVDACWNLLGGFSLIGRVNASMLGGDFHSTLVETNNAGATTLTNINDHFSQIVPVTEMTMGVAWQHSNLRLMAGYQFINWFGLVNVPEFVDDAHQGKMTRTVGDLSLEGLVVQAAWWF